MGMNEDEMTAAMEEAHRKIAALRWRLDEMESRTALTSPSFIRRAFAVLGHYFVASLLIALPIWLVMFIVYLFHSVASH